jgi:hypothetical protein
LAHAVLGEQPVADEQEVLARWRGEALLGVWRVGGGSVVGDVEPAGEHPCREPDQLRTVGVAEEPGAPAAGREEPVLVDEMDTSVVVARQFDRYDDGITVGAAEREHPMGQPCQLARCPANVDAWTDPVLRSALGGHPFGETVGHPYDGDVDEHALGVVLA